MARLIEELASALPELSKAVFSQPIDKLSEQKVMIRPVSLKGAIMYQAEGFRDNKAYHKNYTEAELLSYAENSLEGRYRQVLIVAGSESRQYVLKNNGS